MELRTWMSTPPAKNPTIRQTLLRQDGTAGDVCLTVTAEIPGSAAIPLPCRADYHPGQQWTPTVPAFDSTGMVQIINGDGLCLARSVSESPQFVIADTCGSDAVTATNQLWIPSKNDMPYVANSNYRWLFSESSAQFTLRGNWECDPRSNFQCQWKYVE